ncbi:ALG1 [Candida theae]|uniref:Chitobiosyldiphosphodolichol beta-mannosyltransferase n=1 Tax=Candida theae TaxID=1198502 RepID=A0AAD5FZ11_9ASCO|nr:ALG1 [Candida theae]KAI5958661.1 ALG1 [Candida theae]
MDGIIKYQGFDHIWKYTGPWRPASRKGILIFVLGDLGHSPRMCYHASSFSKVGYDVTLCGYVETHPPSEIVDDLNIDIVPIGVVHNIYNLPFVLFAAQKILLQVKQLATILWNRGGEMDVIMIQNPPSIPILLIVLLFKFFVQRHWKIVIDWHNLNYTILNLRFQNLNHPLVRLMKGYECYLGKFADLNITVTKKMRKFLINEFGFAKSKVTAFYDRPGMQFKPTRDIELRAKHEIFKDVENVEQYKILISSTSFTPDEDFGLLLDALKLYDKSQQSNTPPILLIVTGKGPLKDKFVQKVIELDYSPRIIVKTAWLASEDYPKILAQADLGVSLHTSSSGIDLPMKIVDFFGSGVPVVSLSFPAIDELVKDGDNGLIVKESTAENLVKLLNAVFTDEELLSKLKNGALKESESRWDENWNTVLRPKFVHN